MTPRADASTAAARREAKNRAVLIEAYRQGLGLAAIAIVEDGTGPQIAAIGAPDAPAANDPRQVVLMRWWCRRAADAERVTAGVARSLRRESKDGIVRPLSHASATALNGLSAAVEGAARRIGVMLYSDADVAADATKMIARVEEQLENLKRTGEFKSVNQSYRTDRLQAAARGEKAAPYADWLNQYKANLIRELAAALRYA